MSKHQHTTPSDEIDLRELACTLWRRKWIVIGITVVSTALAAAYAYTATPVYQASVSLLPPPASALIEFNMQAQQINMAPGTWSNTRPQENSSLINILTPRDATSLFFSYLSSSAVKEKFSTSLAQQDATTSTPSILTSLDASTGKTILTMQSNSPQNLQTWTQEYLQIATQATEKELNLGLSSASKARQEQLRQNLTIAQAVADAGKSTDQTALQQANVVALQTQIAQLQDSPSIALSIPVYTVDTLAVAPTAPIKPKKKLIIALGLVLGSMLGSFLVLLQQSFRRPDCNI